MTVTEKNFSRFVFFDRQHLSLRHKNGHELVTISSKTPEIAVKVSVLNGLDEMFHANLFGAVKIGNGAADFDDSIVRPC